MEGRSSGNELADKPFRPAAVVAEGVSFESFLRFFGEIHAEWLNGTVIELESKTVRHQRLLMFLTTNVYLFVGYKELGTVLPMGVPMFVGHDRPAREPDLMVISDEKRVKENYIDGPADIAVEIVSPESSIRDRGDKFDEYELAGVPEYWLFDPLRRQAVIYELGETARYQPRASDTQGRLTSGLLPGFALDPILLWQDEPPTGNELADLVQQMLAAVVDD